MVLVDWLAVSQEETEGSRVLLFRSVKANERSSVVAQDVLQTPHEGRNDVSLMMAEGRELF
jgi:hypothetical protein